MTGSIQPGTELRPPKNLRLESFPSLQQVRNDHREQLPVVRVGACFVTHSGIALKRLRLVRESVFRNVPPRITRHFHRYAMYKYATERRLRAREPNLLLLHHHWASGYHHWLTESLLKLEFVDPSQYVAVLPEDYPPFARESLSMYPFAEILQLPVGRGLGASSLTLVGNPHSGHFNPDHLRLLRQRIMARCDGPGPQADRIYVTRRGEHLRRVENEDEVVGALEAFGFEVVDPVRLSFRDQVRLFSRCRALVCVHGAGLTNCMFMPEGARVLELYRVLASSNDGMNAVYWRLSTTSGLDYYLQF